MHSEEESHIFNDFANRKDDRPKRTTIILERNERAFVDSLIRDGREPGIKPLISKMLDIYKNLMIYDWRFPGEYYFGISRIALVNVEVLNILIQAIPTERWCESGKNIGEAIKVSMETTFGLETANQDDWDKLFNRLKIQGFGELYVRDKYILLKNPFINDAEVWKGILQGMLEIKVEIKTSQPPLVFEIKPKPSV